jgi:hypothetical protein
MIGPTKTVSINPHFIPLNSVTIVILEFTF